MDPVGVRIQNLPLLDQVLALCRIAQTRADSGRFGPTDIDGLFDEFFLPRPANVSNQLKSLNRRGDITRMKVPKNQPGWVLTPNGRRNSVGLATDMDLAALAAETARRTVTYLADTPHPVIPPSLAPPEFILPLHAFFEDFPFETNVFGMTRFPGEPKEGEIDPITPGLDAAREVSKLHGLTFHLASDRKIVDDLWPNVAAHIWGCQYGIAFFENRTAKGINYNLTIEVGSCLVLGRRLAVLKDEPVKQMPTDLVGKIYQTVDLADVSTVEAELHKWMRDDLKLGPCSKCPK